MRSPDYPMMDFVNHRVWLYVNWIDWSLMNQNIGKALVDLESLIDLVRKNFSEEERAMRECGVSTTLHAREHYQFVERLFGFRALLHRGAPTLEACGAFRTLCLDLRRHVEILDSLTADTLRYK